MSACQTSLDDETQEALDVLCPLPLYLPLRRSPSPSSKSLHFKPPPPRLWDEPDTDPVAAVKQTAWDEICTSYRQFRQLKTRPDLAKLLVDNCWDSSRFQRVLPHFRNWEEEGVRGRRERQALVAQLREAVVNFLTRFMNEVDGVDGQTSKAGARPPASAPSQPREASRASPACRANPSGQSSDSRVYGSEPSSIRSSSHAAYETSHGIAWQPFAWPPTP